MKILNCSQNFQWVGEGVLLQKRGKKTRCEYVYFVSAMNENACVCLQIWIIYKQFVLLKS